MTEETMAGHILDVIDCIGEDTMAEIMEVLGPEAQGDQGTDEQDKSIWCGMS